MMEDNSLSKRTKSVEMVNPFQDDDDETTIDEEIIHDNNNNDETTLNNEIVENSNEEHSDSDELFSPEHVDDLLVLENDDSFAFMKQALTEGEDLQLYTEKIEEELGVTVQDAVSDYLQATNGLVDLHKQISASESILSKMSDILNGFQRDLGEISQEIDYIQASSNSMKMSLTNRRSLEQSLGHFVDKLAINPELIRNICLADVNEGYLNHLKILQQKMKFLEAVKEDNTFGHLKSVQYMGTEIEKLKIKAICRIREFLLYRVFSLRKPKTNVQIIQQSVLKKYQAFNHFLYKYGFPYAEEVKGIYSDTLSKLLLHYFKAYVNSLSKLQIDIATKHDLIGADNSSQLRKKTSSLFTSGSVVPVGGVFSLHVGSGVAKHDRSALLKLVDEMPAIVPHAAQQNAEKFTYDFLFRSMNLMLVDTVSSEYFFDCEFFMKDDAPNIVRTIFEKIVQLLLENLEQYLTNCYDMLGLYIMIGINNHNTSKMQKRKITVLDEYMAKVSKLLWDRFKLVFQLNIESIRKTLTANISASDTRPHFITRRYAEFVGSLLGLNVDTRDQESLMNNLLFTLRGLIEGLLTKLSSSLQRKARTVFLISNYDLILTIMDERGVTSVDVERFKSLHATEVKTFVEEELASYYEPLINFVKKADSDGGAKSTDSVIVERLAKDFSLSFRSVIEQISGNVMQHFSNFSTGTEILKQVLTQLALYYSRFEEIIKRSFKNANELRRDMVSISTLKFEIQKHINLSGF